MSTRLQKEAAWLAKSSKQTFAISYEPMDFRRFPLLPAELRHDIFERAIVPRIVEVQLTVECVGQVRLHSKVATPALLHTSREARDIALRRYLEIQLPAHDSLVKPKYVYVNLFDDIVYFTPFRMVTHMKIYSQMTQFISYIHSFTARLLGCKALAVHSDLIMPWILHKCRKPSDLAGLEQLIIVRQDTICKRVHSFSLTLKGEAPTPQGEISFARFKPLRDPIDGSDPRLGVQTFTADLVRKTVVADAYRGTRKYRFYGEENLPQMREITNDANRISVPERKSRAAKVEAASKLRTFYLEDEGADEHTPSERKNPVEEKGR